VSQTAIAHLRMPHDHQAMLQQGRASGDDSRLVRTILHRDVIILPSLPAGRFSTGTDWNCPASTHVNLSRARRHILVHWQSLAPSIQPVKDSSLRKPNTADESSAKPTSGLVQACRREMVAG